MVTNSRIDIHRWLRLLFPLIVLAVFVFMGLLISSKGLAQGIADSKNAEITNRFVPHHSVLPATTGEPTSSTLFWDDFSGDLSQWTTTSGDWYISDQTLVGDAGGCCGSGIIYAGDPNWTDYVVQTQVISETSNTIFILRSAENWVTEYRVELWWQGSWLFPNHYFAYKLQDGYQNDLPNGFGTSPVPITQSSLLRVQISGSHLVIFVDDQFVADIVDPNPIPHGRFGLGVNSDQAIFDDVLVTTPPPVSLYPVEQTQFGTADGMVTYTLELANYTGATDSFNLELLPGSTWTTTLSTGVLGPIANGDSAYFDAYVAIPSSAQPGDSSNTTIHAASLINPTVYTSTASIATIAYAPSLAYVVTPEKLFMIDKTLYTPIGSIDLAQYGCTSADMAILTPDLRQLYLGCFQNQKILVFYTTDNSYMTSINIPEIIYDGDIAFTRDGAFGVVGGENTKNLYVIDTSSYSVVHIVRKMYTRSLTTHPYLPYIYIAAFENYSGYVMVLDTNTFTIRKVLDLGFNSARAVQASPDGQWVYATGGEKIFKIDANTNEIVDDLALGVNLSAVQVTPDSSKIFINAAGIAVIDSQSFSLIETIYINNNAMDLKFTCDGSELWAATGTPDMPVIDPTDYSIPHNILLPDEITMGIAMCSPIPTGVFTRKLADHTRASTGETVNYTLSMINFSLEDLAVAQISDQLPSTLNFVDGSLHASTGNAEYQDGMITWSGPVTASITAEIYFSAKVANPIDIGTSITNSALFIAGVTSSSRSNTLTVVPWRILMPCSLRACMPILFDNFSDPNSGWPIEDDQYATLGYRDGEYQIYAKQAGWIIYASKAIGATGYKVELDTHPASHIDGGTGIIFDISNEGFYLYEISDGWFSLWRLYNNQWSMRIGWHYSDVLNPGYASNHLAVVRKGNDTYLYANGQLIGFDYDSTLHGSIVGMFSDSFSANYDGRFDNFSVTTGICIGSTPSDFFQAPLPSLPGSRYRLLPSPGLELTPGK